MSAASIQPAGARPAAVLREGLAGLGVSLSDDVQGRLLDYLALLEKWNATINLTAIREPERMVTHHLLDSLSLLPHLAAHHSLADVGTGAGLPGIPLAFARPDLKVTLIEPNQKKVAFLRQAKMSLALDNVTVQGERVQDCPPGFLYDAVVSRAFTDLLEFHTAAAALVAPGGALLAMKGIYPYDELERLPDGLDVQVLPLHVPHLDAQRHLVVMTRAVPEAGAVP